MRGSFFLAIAAAAAAFLIATYWDPARAGGQQSQAAAWPDDGIDRTALDNGTSACTDFYQHACGGFMAAHPATAERPVISRVQSKFEADLNRDLIRLFDEPSTRASELGRLKTFFASCRSGHANDAATVKRWLARIDAATDRATIQQAIRDLASIGVNAFLSYGGRPDRTDPNRYRGEIHSATLWADPGPVQEAFQSAGLSESDARRDAAAVAEIVEALRKHRVDRWDAANAENPASIDQLRQLAPAFEWTPYLAQAGADPLQRINVTSPAYLRALDHELRTRSPADLRAYLRWAFLFSLRGELPAPYNAAFSHLSPDLRAEIYDTNSRCRDATVRAMGVEFSRQYATRILGTPARDSAKQLSETIKDAIVDSLAGDDWLSAEARRATADKLRRTDLKIGFPDVWPAVGHYRLRHDRFLENVLAARRFEQKREWGRVGQARSRTDWEMKVDPWVGEGMAAARLVIPNGFPDAFTNSLIMTAAFLSTPRFVEGAPPEWNYATYGTVFAHEFVHVAQLHMFGPTGLDEELWTPADEQAANTRGQCVIQQANDYHPLPGVSLPGSEQFDENVADYGGVRLAYEALRRTLGTRIDQTDETGTSPAQRFFYRYAQNNCVSQSEASLRQSIERDGHAPPAFRVNAPLSNMPEFSRAFSCPAGAAMARPAANQCRVW
ncbi:M13 family metallopeptidase [Novosphingobium aquimarinum]|uniref:M13 family metallopeptidase n=1 Tax=Novosphingobium aquimarinum TaxID=2682494 RepID=UPI0012EC5118|nr:M13 family metallopeptidase [Novosphingobium aquimarinum]